jgi:ribonuclease BN (tRNA processing enzyme)
MSVTLTVLGAGSAFNFDKGNVSYLVESPDGCALIDCGFTVPGALKAMGKLDAVTDVFITHTHSDHIGGIELLAQWRYFVSLHGNRKQGKPVVPLPRLWAPREVLDKLRLLEELGLGKIQDDCGRPVTATLETYFSRVDTTGCYSAIPTQVGFDVRVSSFPVDHVPGGFPACGYLVRCDHGSLTRTVLISGDTRKVLDYDYITGSEPPFLAFHDCQLFDGGEGDVHANLSAIGREMKEKFRKATYLIHYGGGNPGLEAIDKADGFGFRGFAEPGQRFEVWK